jgi:hypothetical protein
MTRRSLIEGSNSNGKSKLLTGKMSRAPMRRNSSPSIVRRLARTEQLPEENSNEEEKQSSNPGLKETPRRNRSNSIANISRMLDAARLLQMTTIIEDFEDLKILSTAKKV